MRNAFLQVLGSLLLLSQNNHVSQNNHAIGRSATATARTDGSKQDAVLIWQPSHQTDTGVDFSEAAVSNGIVEAAMKTKPRLVVLC